MLFGRIRQRCSVFRNSEHFCGRCGECIVGYSGKARRRWGLFAVTEPSQQTEDPVGLFPRAVHDNPEHDEDENQLGHEYRCSHNRVKGCRGERCCCGSRAEDYPAGLVPQMRTTSIGRPVVCHHRSSLRYAGVSSPAKGDEVTGLFRCRSIRIARKECQVAGYADNWRTEGTEGTETPKAWEAAVAEHEAMDLLAGFFRGLDEEVNRAGVQKKQLAALLEIGRASCMER